MNCIFQAGGALSANHPTYIERQADHYAMRAALNGDYLHIITPRQMGKTSLLKRLVARLGELGWRCAYVDLSTLMDLPKPAWYTELGKMLAEGLTPDQSPQLTNQIDLRRYLLNEALPWQNGQSNIAIFFDEVEGAGKARDTDNKPFSDTFFMTLRNLYIQRDDYSGTIVVALAGAMNPSDLVADPDISPFNVGQELNLDDFAATEASVLTSHLTGLGLPIDSLVHQAIYDWTNGHPYLTQRVCIELEKNADISRWIMITPDNVRYIIERFIFASDNPVQQDKNLKHASRMLNRLSESAAKLWSRLRSGEIISREETTDDIYLELYLTGVVKLQNDRLFIRNRIYESAFIERSAVKPSTINGSLLRSTTMPKPVHVFLSSTWQDLQPEREAVERALHRMRDTAFSGMEYFGSRPETPRDVSLAEVDRSDIYIGIFAHRYGSGITEAEYRRARERGRPCLIYLKDDSVPVPPAYIERDAGKTAQLDALKNELKANHTVSLFKNPDDLATQVAADLHNHLGNTPPAPPLQPSIHGDVYNITMHDVQGVAIGNQAQVTQWYGEQGGTSSVAPDLSDPTQVLLERLLQRFDQEELRTLCFKLGVEFDDLRGEGRAGKARELVRLMQRQKQLDRLQQAIEGTN